MQSVRTGPIPLHDLKLELVYENTFDTPQKIQREEDLLEPDGEGYRRSRLPDRTAEWVVEGLGGAAVVDGRLHVAPVALGPDGEPRADGARRSHTVVWTRRKLPDNFLLEFDVNHEGSDNGLTLLLLCAAGADGGGLFDRDQPPRRGNYRTYHSGQIANYTVSYWSRNRGEPKRHEAVTTRLRKNPGFHRVAMGRSLTVGPTSVDHRVRVLKLGSRLTVEVNGHRVVDWEDTGNALGAGHIGLRCMSGVRKVTYDNFRVWSAAPAAPLDPSAGEWLYRIHVDAGDMRRFDHPVEAELALPDAVAPGSLRLLEVSASNSGDSGDGALDDTDILLTDVPMQISPLRGEDEKQTLVFLLQGETAAGVGREFALIHHEPAGSVNPTSQPRPFRPRKLRHEGQESLSLPTPDGVYVYHLDGAAFASLYDLSNRDWISYNPGVGARSGSGSGGKFRGIPNLGHPEGYCHPGHERSSSRLVHAGPLRTRIASQSKDGKMRCVWDILPHGARLTLETLRTPYWFLYEGTPGGTLDVQRDYCLRPTSEGPLRTPLAHRWDGDLEAPGEPGEWIAFGDGEDVLFLASHIDDDAHDSYWPMHEEMTVFGFGRRGLEKFLRRQDAQFTIGLREGTSFEAIREQVRAAYMPVQVSVSRQKP